MHGSCGCFASREPAGCTWWRPTLRRGPGCWRSSSFPRASFFREGPCQLWPLFAQRKRRGGKVWKCSFSLYETFQITKTKGSLLRFSCSSKRRCKKHDVYQADSRSFRGSGLQVCVPPAPRGRRVEPSRLYATPTRIFLSKCTSQHFDLFAPKPCFVKTSL